MASKLAIHIAPEANPDNIIQLIVALAKIEQEFSSVAELMNFADGIGIGSRTEIQATAFNMGLIEKVENYRLSNNGRAFARLKEAVQKDILHYLMYCGWHVNNPTAFLPSWAYRRACDQYWEANSIELSADYLDQQVLETISDAETTFSSLGVGEFDGISFSRKSLGGGRKWLEALSPPVITEGKFTRRDFCSPELLLLAIGFVMRDEPEITDIDILLSRNRRDEICRVCLLEPTALDQALDWMLPIFSKVVISTEEAGYYGRYIRLLKRPSIEDLIR